MNQIQKNYLKDFFGELKNIIKSGVNAIKEQKEIMAQIFSAENLSKFAESINAELQTSGESTENKEALKKSINKGFITRI